jgi:hypothetical protein
MINKKPKYRLNARSITMLVSRIIASKKGLGEKFSINLTKATTQEIEESRCKKYDYAA